VDLLLAVLAGALAAVLTTPAGVSGAVFLIPVQVGLLGIAPAVAAPTNLVFNLFTAPVGLRRLRRAWRLDARVLVPMLAAALPAMAVGALLRALDIVGAGDGRILVAVVMGVVGLALLVVPAREGVAGRPASVATIAVVAGASGVVGGLYGIGGGAVMVPVLVALGAALPAVAPAALATTLATSALGLAVFQVASAAGAGPGADWGLALALGAGGVVGAHIGAGLAPRIPLRLLRAALGVIGLLLAVRVLMT
jgi:uncharacterized membrane protein YfcA